MPEHAEHGAASSQPKLDSSLSTPSNAPPSGPPGSPFMPWGWMTAIPTKPSPLDLTMDRGESFKLWKRRWESFFRLSYLDAQPPMMQYDVLVSCLADNTLKVVDNFDLASDKKHDVTTIINALERYAKGQLNETVEHHNLLSRVQQPGERFDDFYLDLRELSRTCSFCDNCTKTILRDCIVRGVRSAETVGRPWADAVKGRSWVPGFGNSRSPPAGPGSRQPRRCGVNPEGLHPKPESQ